jgi:hypothetical protein
MPMTRHFRNAERARRHRDGRGQNSKPHIENYRTLLRSQALPVGASVSVVACGTTASATILVAALVANAEALTRPTALRLASRLVVLS